MKIYKGKINKVCKIFLLPLPKYLIYAFSIITILFVFVPLNPRMPQSGLDPSWVISMNEAVAQNLKIGKEIIFTFGPYASIYTQSYHPATDNLMIFGSIFLGICYAVSLLYLANERKLYILFGFLFFLSGLMCSRDSLFFSYPLILAAITIKFITEHDQYKNEKPTPWIVLFIAIIFAPLGLLPLIKGSFLLICCVITVAISAYFFHNHYLKLALIVLISPLFSIVIFWVVAGQSLSILPSYLVNMLPIISGYTDAMSSTQDNNIQIIEIIAYLFAALTIIWILVKSGERNVQTKVFLSLCFALFLFISFKGGFVRHDGHAIIAGTSLIFAILIISFLFTDKRLIIALLISIFTWAVIDAHYTDTSSRQVFKNIRNTYVNSWVGLRSRMKDNNNLKNNFESTLDELGGKYPISTLQGTSDIYSYNQTYILASDKKWNPRPIFQSYSAYTPKLAQINEQHLRGNSPDNVLFQVQPIDGRLPSLEDGLSWPALFDNYTVNKIENELVYLYKNQITESNSTYNVIHKGTYQIGDEVLIPITNAPIFAKLDLKTTILGKFLEIIFKPPQLNLKLKLADGSIKDYRVISSMMQSGFFISPLVENNRDFVLLATGNQHYLKNKMVESIKITSSYGGSVFWGPTYTLELKTYVQESVSSLPENFFDEMLDSIPIGYVEGDPSNCDGFIDVVNGVINPQAIKMSGISSIEGWLAFSVKYGIAPDDIFVTLKNQDEIIKFINTRRTPRDDVRAYFQQPTMPDVGFSTTFDVTALDGEYLLGLAIGYQGNLTQCKQFNIPIVIENTE